MIIHSLTLHAYGPFPQEEHLDFEHLNEAGIFLLNGPTGAGKTSILDAIGFALYGETPTARPDLHSHFADPHAEPRVELEFTVGTERLKIIRTPKWVEPSRRARNGRAERQAKVIFSRYEDGQWQTLSTRNDEAGEMIQERIGLKREQFAQVILLPQGEFAKFLNSKSAEREVLLKKLFDTRNFEAVQAQLMERARAAESSAAEAQREVETLTEQLHTIVHRARLTDEQTLYTQAIVALIDSGAQEAAHRIQELEVAANLSADAVPAASGVASTDLVAEPTLEETSEFERLHTVSSKKIKAAQERLMTACDLLKKQQNDLSEQVTAMSRHIHDWKLFEELRQRSAHLDARSSEIEQLQQDLRLAHQAAPLVPIIRQAEKTQQECTHAQAAWETAQEQVTARLSLMQEVPAQKHHPEASVLTASAEEMPQKVADALSLLDQLKDATQQLDKAQDNLEKSRQALASTQKKIVQSAEQEAEKTAQIQQLEKQLAPLENINQLVYEAKKTLADHQGILDLSNAAESQNKKITTAELTYAHDEEKRRLASIHAEQLQRTRFEQAAYLLAQNLVAEEPCPVCGSAEHPRPAKTIEDKALIEQADIDKAVQERNRAENTAQESLALLNTARSQLKSLLDRGAIDPADAQRQVEIASQELAQAQAQQKNLQELEQQLNTARSQLEKLQEAGAVHTQAEASCQQSISIYTDTITQLNQQLEGARTERTFAKRKKLLQEYAQAVAGQSKAQEYAQQSTERYQEAQKALRQGLARAGFETVQAALAATLEQNKSDEYSLQIQEFTSARERTKGQLESPALLAIAQAQQAGQKAPDTELLGIHKKQAHRLEELRDQALQLLARLVDSSTVLDDLQENYQHKSASSAQLIDTATRWRLLADTANGTSSDNSLRMTLTTYVLAAQLREVTANASDHLKKMTHGRYSLEYSHEKEAGKGRGNSKSGLGIVVRDAWHDAERPTKSLSGGETFMASLALALGLAETVQQRSGGIDIATLFVDEGFGSLDDATLEEVMSTLDSLRAGGRVIGLISHVAEMKNRIATQVLVKRSPEGSHIVTV